jgi:hypothetical protein
MKEELFCYLRVSTKTQKEEGKQSCKQNVITKNDNILVRCERGWKDKVKGISNSIGVPSSVFIRESVNKNINSLTQ